jgi:hypothetical protein
MKKPLKRRRKLLPQRRKVLVTKPLFAKIVEMILSLPLARKHFILRRGSITHQFAARVAKTPRKDEWMVVDEGVVGVEEVIEVEVVGEEEAEEFVTLSKGVNATEEVIADSRMRVEEGEVEEAVVAEEDVVVDVAEEEEEFVTHFKRENATVAPHADTLMNRLFF